jgi:hypothetical protein
MTSDELLPSFGLEQGVKADDGYVDVYPPRGWFSLGRGMRPD